MIEILHIRRSINIHSKTHYLNPERFAHFGPEHAAELELGISQWTRGYVGAGPTALDAKLLPLRQPKT